MKITYLSFPCLSVYPILICQPKTPRGILDIRKMQSGRLMYLYISAGANTEVIVVHHGQPLTVRKLNLLY